MKRLIQQHGPCQLRLRRDRLEMLLRSIAGQQLSTKAASTIFARFRSLYPAGQWSAEHVAATPIEQLREVGLSRRKAEYVVALAKAVDDGDVRLNQIGRLDDEQIIAQLTQVKGIGRWTAQMFLMFSLGRMDILPHDDLGIRRGIMHQYQLDELPSAEHMDAIAAPWRPYCTIACWYIWCSED